MTRTAFFCLFGLASIGLLLSGCGESPDQLASPVAAGESAAETAAEPSVEKPPFPPPEGMVWIAAGTFKMGCDILNGGRPDEMPVHTVELDGFYMDQTEVTNAQFMEFVEATGYVTMAEREVEFRSLKPGVILDVPPGVKPGSICMNPDLKIAKFDPELGAYQWSDYIVGANWKHPEGPGSSIKDRMDHPVVHVSWLDAKAYCDWAGKTLPTEAQWEYAARGGLDGRVYPWGYTHNPGGEWRHNIWQGPFPMKNTEDDGFRGAAPVGSFPANRYGLHDMSGNVWEWVADYYRPDYYAHSPRKNPPGPKNSLDPEQPHIIKRVQRGGSFMCANSYCIGYRCAARMKGEQDTGAFHTGFRCVMTPEMLKSRMEKSKK